MDNAATSYFYSPIAFYNGHVLKCGGIATAANAEWFKAERPGTIILEGYRGDRIDAVSHKLHA